MTMTKRLTTLILATACAIGLSACGGGSSKTARVVAPDQTTAIGVNGFLWRATLDTMSFMPLVEVDAASGVLVTDWYVNPQVQSERLKVSVFILDKDLRADALKVSVLRQELINGNWVNGAVRAGTALSIEESILTRARQLRISTIDD